MGQDAVLKIVRQFKNALESINIRVDQLILFGSHAVGTAREDSDIANGRPRVLNDPEAPYIANFGGKNDVLSLQNAHFWNVYPEMSAG